ncbi:MULTISPECIES: hypothetical protein [Paraburkholderia]|uniref:Uncharacterized protein n=1 Tax=Paraburkholderia acidicola TaxID=1912599 RepID=A0ABV1LY98_9BURK
MTYSCCDFYDDVMRCFVDTGVVASEHDDGVDAVGADSDLAITAITGFRRMALASTFFDELLASVETLGSVAEQYGEHALASLMYLQSAISHDAFIEVSRDASAFLDVIRMMPSSTEWLRHIELVD